MSKKLQYVPEQSEIVKVVNKGQELLLLNSNNESHTIKNFLVLEFPDGSEKEMSWLRNHDKPHFDKIYEVIAINDVATVTYKKQDENILFVDFESDKYVKRPLTFYKKYFGLLSFFVIFLVLSLFSWLIIRFSDLGTLIANSSGTFIAVMFCLVVFLILLPNIILNYKLKRSSDISSRVKVVDVRNAFVSSRRRWMLTAVFEFDNGSRKYFELQNKFDSENIDFCVGDIGHLTYKEWKNRVSFVSFKK